MVITIWYIRHSVIHWMLATPHIMRQTLQPFWSGASSCEKAAYAKWSSELTVPNEMKVKESEDITRGIAVGWCCIRVSWILPMIYEKGWEAGGGINAAAVDAEVMLARLNARSDILAALRNPFINDNCYACSCIWTLIISVQWWCSSFCSFCILSL